MPAAARLPCVLADRALALREHAGAEPVSISTSLRAGVDDDCGLNGTVTMSLGM